jgi:hypothetical protein
MVKGVADERAQRGVEEGITPQGVDECAIQTDEGGNLPIVGPGEPPVEEGEILEHEVVDEGVEAVSHGRVETVVVLVAGVPGHVEVSQQNPWERPPRREVPKLGKERVVARGFAWGVHIYNREGRGVSSELEVDCEREL